MHDAIPGIGHELHDPRLTGLEAHGRSGGDIQAEAARLFPIEAERIVGLVEMIMRADLDRPVSSIGDLEGDGRAAGVQLDVARARENFAGNHAGPPYRIGLWTVTSLVPSGKVASTWISATISAMPSITCARDSTVAPSRMSSATERPSRAP